MGKCHIYKTFYYTVTLYGYSIELYKCFLYIKKIMLFEALIVLKWKNPFSVFTLEIGTEVY